MRPLLLARWLLVAALLLGLAGTAYAACVTNTTFYGGRSVTCTTCCWGGTCTTTCF